MLFIHDRFNSRQTMNHYVRYLIAGSDTFSLLAFDRLVRLYGKDQVGLLCNLKITESSIALKGPGPLRKEANISYLKKHNHNLFQNNDLINSVFFKEKKFHSFFGKSLSEKLLPAEDFYIHPRIDINMENFLSFENKKEFLSLVNSRQIKHIPVSIYRYISENSEEEVNFKIVHSDGTITCNHLIWGYSPSAFLRICSDKRIFGEKIEYNTSDREIHALYVRFKLKEQISNQKETLFIPLSYTHPWGHFIGEFQTQNGKQEVEFVTFLDKDQANEDEVIKKIKILKRNLKKIYPNFKKFIQKESIGLDEISLDFLDELYPRISSLDYIDFIGQTAPMNQIHQNLSHFARGLESLRLLEERIVS